MFVTYIWYSSGLAENPPVKPIVQREKEWANLMDFFRCDSISQHLPLSVSGSGSEWVIHSFTFGDSYRISELSELFWMSDPGNMLKNVRPWQPFSWYQSSPTDWCCTTQLSPGFFNHFLIKLHFTFSDKTMYIFANFLLSDKQTFPPNLLLIKLHFCSFHLIKLHFCSFSLEKNTFLIIFSDKKHKFLISPVSDISLCF